MWKQGKPGEMLLPASLSGSLCLTDLNSGFLTECRVLMEQIVTVGVVVLKFVCLMHFCLESTVWWSSGRAVIFAMYFLRRMRNTWKCKLKSTRNSAENRHDHRHHFHQRGNRNREFMTCSRSHTELGAELLGGELSPPCLVLQPQDDLSKWFVLGTC